MNLRDTALKDIFFSVDSVGLISNEATIVVLKALFVLNGTFITFSGGSHHQIRFLAFTKNGASSLL